MNQSKIYNFLIQNVSALDGVGIKTKKLLNLVIIHISVTHDMKCLCDYKCCV